MDEDETRKCLAYFRFQGHTFVFVFFTFDLQIQLCDCKDHIQTVVQNLCLLNPRQVTIFCGVNITESDTCLHK